MVVNNNGIINHSNDQNIAITAFVSNITVNDKINEKIITNISKATSIFIKATNNTIEKASKI